MMEEQLEEGGGGMEVRIPGEGRKQWANIK